MVNSEEEILYEKARKKVKKLKGFYIHLLVYLVVNTMIIFAIHNNADSNEKWLSFENYSMAFYWGIGLVAHGLSLFSLDFVLGTNWENHKIKEIMDKEKSKNDIV